MFTVARLPMAFKGFLTQLSVAFLLVGLLVTHSAGQSLQPPTELFNTTESLHLLDANNRTLGRVDFNELSGSINDLEVLLEISDSSDIIRLAVQPWGFGPTRILLGFASTDCSGPAYLVTIEPQGFFAPAAITGPGHTLWVPDRSTPPEGFFLESFQVRPTEDDPTPCRQVLVQSAFGPRARALVDLDTLYTLPFRLVNTTHVHRQTTRTLSGPALIRATE